MDRMTGGRTPAACRSVILPFPKLLLSVRHQEFCHLAHPPTVVPMSPGAEGSDAPDAEHGTATLAPGRPTAPGRPAARGRGGSTAHGRDHHLLLDPHED